MNGVLTSHETRRRNKRKDFTVHEKYFLDYCEYVKEEYSVDILGELGLEIGEEGDGNE